MVEEWNPDDIELALMRTFITDYEQLVRNGELHVDVDELNTFLAKHSYELNRDLGLPESVTLVVSKNPWDSLDHPMGAMRVVRKNVDFMRSVLRQ